MAKHDSAGEKGKVKQQVDGHRGGGYEKYEVEGDNVKDRGSWLLMKRTM